MRLNVKVSTLLLGVSLVFYVILYSLMQSERLNPIFSTKILLFNLLILLIFFLQEEPYFNLKKQYVRITTIFILGYIVVFFQLHLDYILGNIQESFTRLWVNFYIVPKSLIISSIGLVAFLFGYSVKKQIGNKISSQSTKVKLPLGGYNFISTAFLIIFLLTIDPLYVAGGYGIFEMGETARFCSILFELSFTAGLVQHIINLNIENKNSITPLKFIKSIGYFRIALLIIYGIVVLASGDRGPVIYLCVGIAASYIVLSKFKISILRFVGVFFIASLTVSSLVVIRNNENTNTPILEQLFDALLGKEHDGGYVALKDVNSVSNSTMELSTSIRTLHNSVNEVPEKTPFFYGQFQLLQIVTIVPLAQQVVKSTLDIKDTELTSAKYVTELVGAKNGSEGTSCIADLYLDFGVLGVILGMFGFGYYTRFIEVEALGKNFSVKTISIISFIIICQYAIYIPRATILFNLRNIVWIWAIMNIIQVFTPIKKRI